MKTLISENEEKSQLSLECKIDNSYKDTVQFEIDRINKKVSCVYSEELTKQLNKLIEHINSPVSKNDLDYTKKTKNLALYPIFISSRLRPSARNEHSNDKYTSKLNIWDKQIREKLSKCGLSDVNERFKIFLFIEGGHDNDRRDFKDEIEYYENLRRFTDSGVNPVTLCYFPERNLGIGRKRKIMMMFAEHLKLRRYYFLDDDIKKFERFDHRSGRKENADTDVVNALGFMLEVMEHELGLPDMQVFAEENLKKWVKKVTKMDYKDDTLYDLLYDMVQMNSTDRGLQRNRLLDLVSQYQQKHNDDVFLNDIKVQLSGRNTVGQVALLNGSKTDSDMDDLKSNHNPIRLVVILLKMNIFLIIENLLIKKGRIEIRRCVIVSF